MSSKTPISLSTFFVFNSLLGPKEGEEHKKILYYFPADTDIDNKIRNIGLCEAIIKFTETFTDKPCQSLHTQKHRQVFFQPEPNIWMVMTASVPSSQKVKEGQTYKEYHEESVQDLVLEAVLQLSYKMFRLFMGNFESIMACSGEQGLRQRLEHFFSRYLLTLRLHQNDVLDVFNGIQFLPLDKNTYLRIQCFINLLEAQFSQLKYTAFLYNDQLVWSGLEQDDMRIVFHYLITSLFPTTMEQELQNTHQSGGVGSHYGRFITGPPNMKDESNLGKVPRVYLNSDGIMEECHLVVYKALSATVCLFIDGDVALNYEFFKKLDNFLGSQTSHLASDISEQYSKRAALAGDVQFKYIYFNHMNLAQKTTVHDVRKAVSSTTVPQDILRLISDINSDLNGVTMVEDGETIIKTCTDSWVVAKKSDQREIYVIVNQRNANLIEINEEVKKLCSLYFNNIFFTD